MTVVAGAYMFAIKAAFYPIMAIYQIVSIVTICIYIYLYMRNEKLTAKEEQSLSKDEAIYKQKKRKIVLKRYVALFLPFIVTIMCDYTYVLLLSEQDWFVALINFFN